MDNGERLCPKCGSPISWVEEARRRDRIYVIAVHYEGYSRDSRGKVKVKRRKCYLGPKGEYVYVSRTHYMEGLVLRGLHDRRRILDYLEALASHLAEKSHEIPRPTLKALARKLESLAHKLQEIAETGVELNDNSRYR